MNRVLQRLREGMPPGYINIPFDAIEALRDEMAATGRRPPEVEELYRQLRQEMTNAEALMVAFGGQIDMGSVNRCVQIKREIDDAWARAALACGRYLDQTARVDCA